MEKGETITIDDLKIKDSDIEVVRTSAELMDQISFINGQNN